MELVWASGLLEATRRSLLQSAPLESGGAILGRLVGDDPRGPRVLAISLELPQPEEIAGRSSTLRIDATFWARVTKKARRERMAVFPIHTHPADAGVPSFSWTDDRGEQELLPVIRRLSGSETAAIVISPGGERLGSWDSTGKRVLGTSRDVGTPRTQVSTRGASDRRDRFSRQVAAFGTSGQTALQALTVGVVGASGVGSHVCEQLIRLGVGRLIVIDPDVVEDANLNRIVTAFNPDAMAARPKVACVASYAELVASGTTVVPIQGNVLDIDTVALLTHVDAIFGCTDTLSSRAIMNRVATQWFVPYWDCGTEIARTGEDLVAFGRVRLVLAGGACLVCMGVIDPTELRNELLPETERQRERQLGYIRGVNMIAPAIVSVNGVTASLAVTSFLHWAVGVRPSVPVQWTYRSKIGDVRTQLAIRHDSCPVCAVGARLGRTDMPLAL